MAVISPARKKPKKHSTASAHSINISQDKMQDKMKNNTVWILKLKMVI